MINAQSDALPGQRAGRSLSALLPQENQKSCRLNGLCFH